MGCNKYPVFAFFVILAENLLILWTRHSAYVIDYYKIRGVNKGLFALALGTFAHGITEFLMMGILVYLAKDLSVSVGEAVHLISAYATGV